MMVRNPQPGWRTLVGGGQLDDFSPFRRHLRRARMARRWPVTVTLTDLRDQWVKQNGRCAITGMPLDNPPTSHHRIGDQLGPWRASLDRVDSSRGYEPGNIQWVCVMANFCKNRWSLDDVRQFAAAVVANS